MGLFADAARLDAEAPSGAAASVPSLDSDNDDDASGDGARGTRGGGARGAKRVKKSTPPPQESETEEDPLDAFMAANDTAMDAERARTSERVKREEEDHVVGENAMDATMETVRTEMETAKVEAEEEPTAASAEDD